MFQGRVRLVFAAAAFALALAAASCDFTPTSPFAGFGGEKSATLRGRFDESAVAGSAQLTVVPAYRAQSTVAAASEVDALTVIVLDSQNAEIGSVDVKNGTFTLRGLPKSFSLLFVDENGNPVGDPMFFDAVKPNQEIDIVVAMVDGEVVLLEQKRTGIDHPGSSGIELQGAAHNIVIDSPTDKMTGSLVVNGYRVLSRAAQTSIRKGNRSLTLEDLHEGDQVHVRGVFEGQDVFAFEIKLQEEEDENTSPEACNVRDPEKPNHILICHKGRTLSVSPDAWPDHRGHGDTCGPC